jgi:hypothetical protein
VRSARADLAEVALLAFAPTFFVLDRFKARSVAMLRRQLATGID